MKNKKLYHFIKQEFPQYAHKTAFFLGNGINNYSKTTSSWWKLLNDLAKKFIGNQYDYESILSSNSIAYNEFFDIIQLTGKNIEVDINENSSNYRQVKEEVRRGLREWTPTITHTAWVNACKSLKRPILTTNFDTLLAESDESIIKFITSQKNNKRSKNSFKPVYLKPKDNVRFIYQYPWHSYYSDHIVKNSINEFAIWHLHGFDEYKGNIRLGLDDYSSLSKKAKTWLHNTVGNPFHQLEDSNKWIGNNSWLDNFMHSNLMFIGLGLDTQETFLRWLLLERKKLCRAHSLELPKSWYIDLELKKKDIKSKRGQYFFFEQVGIEVIYANDYHQMYKALPKHLVSLSRKINQV